MLKRCRKPIQLQRVVDSCRGGKRAAFAAFPASERRVYRGVATEAGNKGGIPAPKGRTWSSACGGCNRRYSLLSIKYSLILWYRDSGISVPNMNCSASSPVMLSLTLTGRERRNATLAGSGRFFCSDMAQTVWLGFFEYGEREMNDVLQQQL